MSKRTGTTNPNPNPTAAAKTEPNTPSLEGTLQELLGQMKALNNKVDAHVKGCNGRLDRQDERLDCFNTRLQRVEEHLGIDPAPANPAKKSPKGTEGEAVAKTEAEPKPAGTEGLYKAYTYWDPEKGRWYVTESIWTAIQGSRGGEWRAVWVLYKGGQIDHVLTPAEIHERKLATPV